MQLVLLVCACLSAAFGDFADFGIIIGLVLVNGLLGYQEEAKALAALDELTSHITSSVTCIRDSASSSVTVDTLVPGDVILLVGGTQVPADVIHRVGDVLSVDTAALTGEPIPRKYPGEHGVRVMMGCTVCEGEAYCQVVATGVNTETGRASKDGELKQGLRRGNTRESGARDGEVLFCFGRSDEEITHKL